MEGFDEPDGSRGYLILAVQGCSRGQRALRDRYERTAYRGGTGYVLLSVTRCPG